MFLTYYDGANEDKSKTMKLDGPRVATLALSPNSQEETKETRATTSVASEGGRKSSQACS